MQKRNKAVAFKNNAPFIKCISKINGVKIDNEEDLDVLILMYDLLETSKNYWKTTGSLSNYYRDEPSDALSSNSESFRYKTSVTENTYDVAEKFQMMMVMKLIILNMRQIKLKLLFH